MVRNKSENPPLDRWRVDEVLEQAQLKLWGLPMIAKALGVSVGTARAWARLPEVPIYRPSGTGTYFAVKGELMAWLRSKKDNESNGTV